MAGQSAMDVATYDFANSQVPPNVCGVYSTRHQRGDYARRSIAIEARQYTPFPEETSPFPLSPKSDYNDYSARDQPSKARHSHRQPARSKTELGQGVAPVRERAQVCAWAPAPVRQPIDRIVAAKHIMREAEHEAD